MTNSNQHFWLQNRLHYMLIAHSIGEEEEYVVTVRCQAINRGFGYLINFNYSLKVAEMIPLAFGTSLILQGFRQVIGIHSRTFHLSCICEAARKGTREKARKKKVKVEEKKVGFIPHNLRNKDKLGSVKVNRHIDDSWKATAEDNVYVGRYYKWRVYSVEEAINCHRETHHPTMYNVPNAPLNMTIELNMQAEKATKYVDNFQRMASIPHKFDHGEERKILVFTKDINEVKEWTKTGSTLVGDVGLIKDIQNGEVQLSDYQYVIAHPSILPELVSLRGLMKKKFPNPKSGTLGTDILEIIKRFANGISYSATKDENQQDFGLISISIGTLDMDAKHLEENLIAVLSDVNSIRPKRQGKFITRVLLKSPPSGEQLKIDPFVYIPEDYTKNSRQEEITEGAEAVSIG